MCADLLEPGVVDTALEGRNGHHVIMSDNGTARLVSRVYPRCQLDLADGKECLWPGL